MRGGDRIRRIFRLGIAGGDADREVDRELEFHFEETVSALRASGMSESEARAEARRRFGDERRYRRELRRLARRRDRWTRFVEGLEAAGGVVADAGRGLTRAPALSVSVVLILAVGVGANATMFGILDRVFLRPPAHVVEPEGVRRVFEHFRASATGEIVTQSTFPYPDYADLTDLGVFSDVAAYSSRTLTVGHGPDAEEVPVTLATASIFPLLGVHPARGRFFDTRDDAVGAPRVAVLGWDYWRRRYDGDPGAIGATIDAGAGTYTIIGVAPPDFTGVDLESVDVWLPLMNAGELEEGGTGWLDARNWYWIQVVARLSPGVPVERAEAAATTVHRSARADLENGSHPESRIELASLILARTDQATRESRVVPWLMGVALLVLLLTCANVANLLLARAMRRQRETAVRLALGVSRSRLVATVMAESVLLALIGGVAAVALAVWGGEVLRAFLLPDVAWNAAGRPGRVLLFSAGIAVFAGVLAAAVPAFRAGRPHVTEALRSASRGVSRARSLVRSALLVTQAAISVVLLVGTALFVQSLRAARDVDLGFSPNHMVVVRLEAEGGYPGAQEMTRLYRDARQRVRGLPGVEATAITTVLPFRNSRGIGDDLRVPGLDSLPRTRAGGAYITAVTGGYFETMELSVLRGRGLDDSDDDAGAPRVAVVNRTMAELVWPDRDPIGQCLLIRDAPCTTVVGIVENHHRFELDEYESMHYYVPLAHAPYPWPPSRLLVHTARPGYMAGPLQRALQGEIPGVRLVTAELFREIVAPQYRAWTLGTTLFGGFGLLALLVAALGLYSVLAFDVAERRSELGIRSALGASRRGITGLVVRDGVRLAAAGVGIGLVAALLLGPRIQPLLYGVDPRAPGALAAVAATVLAVAVVASAMPAWRAARVDPAATLRSD